MDEEKKKKKREWGETLGKIANILKALKNPIILWASIILVCIIFLIGVVGFLISLPGNTLENFANFLEKITHTDYVYNVDQAELKELCKTIEENGYDLESYGFVEEIKRKGEKTYEDETFADGETPERGEIEYVKSKYLEAYLVAEKKTYVIANPEYQQEMEMLYNQLNYREFYNYQAVSEVFQEFWEGGRI